MDNKPCCVVASCTDTNPEDIIKLILDTNNLPEPSAIEEGIKAYPWHIDNKYYVTDINLCAVDNKTVGSEKFAVSVEAIVINFDSERSDGLNVVDSWLSFLNEFEPEVQILLCQRCHENPNNGVSKVEAQKWCVERGFELVELDPELDEEWEQEQDFLETTGIKRVVQALHAHLWPNLRMKGRSQNLSKTVQSMLNGSTDSNIMNNDNSNKMAELNEDMGNINIDNNSHLDDQLDELLGDSGGVAGFASLFEQLAGMKDRVANLPTDQRRAAAEQVVMAFWKAIGGDDDELPLPNDLPSPSD